MREDGGAGGQGRAGRSSADPRVGGAAGPCAGGRWAEWQAVVSCGSSGRGRRGKGRGPGAWREVNRHFERVSSVSLGTLGKDEERRERVNVFL